MIKLILYLVLTLSLLKGFQLEEPSMMLFGFNIFLVGIILRLEYGR